MQNVTLLCGLSLVLISACTPNRPPASTTLLPDKIPVAPPEIKIFDIVAHPDTVIYDVVIRDSLVFTQGKKKIKIEQMRIYYNHENFLKGDSSDNYVATYRVAFIKGKHKYIHFYNTLGRSADVGPHYLKKLPQHEFSVSSKERWSGRDFTNYCRVDLKKMKIYLLNRYYMEHDGNSYLKTISTPMDEVEYCYRNHYYCVF